MLGAAGFSGAVDFSVRVRPHMSVPLGLSTGRFTAGGGLDAALDVDISSVLSNPLDIGYSLGPDFGINIAPVYKVGTPAYFYSGGIGASLFFYPLSRLSLRAGGGAGIYQAEYQGFTNANIFWKCGGEAGFRFSPNFILSVNAGFKQYNDRPGDPNYAGVYGGVTVQYAFETGSKNRGVSVVLDQDEPVFPVFAGLYRQNRIGTLRITNHESAEIRNVRVSFQAGNYTASRLVCGTVSRLGKRRTAEIPLYADFSAAILNFSENGRIPGDVFIEYEFLGARRTAAGSAVVAVNNRNSYRWADPMSLAVFVSPAVPEVLDYAKYIVGLARNHLRTGLNRNMQFALYLYEGLRAAGLTGAPDQQTPYELFRGDSEKVDAVQFPFQTLAYRSGDLDELGLLYAASLEAAGIKTALIPLKDDFVVAFSLGIGEGEADNLFDGLDDLLIIDDEVWLPIASGGFRDGFINSWYTAMNGINESLGAGLDFIVLQDAWRMYPPAAVSLQETYPDKPPEVNVVRLAETGMLRYISSEFGPKIEALQNRMRAGEASPALYNQLGLLYVRAGMYDDARTEYQRAAAMGYVSAMVNLGNLAMLERNAAAAEQWYNQALRMDPANRVAAEGLNQIVLERIEQP
jgi:tetratricopeptide (TPR) repeat protein